MMDKIEASTAMMTKSDSLITTVFQPDGKSLWYVKLYLFDLHIISILK